MSRMTYFSADEVDEICDRMRAEHYPCDVIHLDTGWFRTDWLCEWKFNEERFPDPKGFIGRLKRTAIVSLYGNFHTLRKMQSRLMKPEPMII